MVIGADAEAPPFVPAQSPVARCTWLSVLILISVALAFAFLQENKFPAMWHPEEPSKVNFIITGSSYFNHPLLLLRLTKLMLEATTPYPNPEDVVIAGRQVSAVAAALSVLMLALAAARLSGYLASLFVALIVGSCPLLFGLAHYIERG
jgi:Na+/serine symporter